MWSLWGFNCVTLRLRLWKSFVIYGVKTREIIHLFSPTFHFRTTFTSWCFSIIVTFWCFLVFLRNRAHFSWPSKHRVELLFILRCLRHDFTGCIFESRYYQRDLLNIGAELLVNAKQCYWCNACLSCHWIFVVLPGWPKLYVLKHAMSCFTVWCLAQSNCRTYYIT